MNKETLEEFLKYCTENPNVKFQQFVARAAQDDKLPTTYYHYPRGVVSVCPEYLIFLTSVEDTPGQSLMIKGMIHEVTGTFEAVWKIKEWAEDPSSIAKDAISLIKKIFESENDPRFFEKLLLNKNSFCIPLKKIKTLKRERVFTQGVYIRLEAKEKYNVCQDMNYEHPIPATISWASVKWRNDVYSMIENICCKQSK
jgi:hypothetical protein